MSDLVMLFTDPKEAFLQGYDQAKAKDADTITRLTAEVEWHKQNSDKWQDTQAAHLREVTRLTAEVERLRAALQWQPIETAPRDGTPILAREKGAGPAVYMMCAMWSGSELEGWRIPGARGWTNARWFHPTHWMHLPPPPALKENNNDQG
jgi:hypothetical protein